jgi:hypothetical protein
LAGPGTPGEPARRPGPFHESTLADFSLPRHITDKVAYTEATEALARAKHERDRDEVLLERALDADAKESDALGKLARYERSLERSLFRTLDELRQRQDRRRNRPSPPTLNTVTLVSEGTE